MIEQFNKYLNCNECLRQNLGSYTEAFVEYYGEDLREEITSKFSKIIPIAYMSPRALENTIDKIRDYFNDELFDKLKKEIPSVFEQDELFLNYRFDDLKYSPIMNFKEFYESFALGKEGRLRRYKETSLANIQCSLPTFTEEEYEEVVATKTIPEKYNKIPEFFKNNILYFADLSNAEKGYSREFDKIKKLLVKVDPNVTLESVNKVLENDETQKLLRYIEKIPEMVDEYNNSMSKYEPYIKTIEENKSRENQLREEYFFKFIEENKHLLNDEDYESIEKRKNIRYGALTNRAISILGYDLTSTSNYQAFSSESEEILNGDEKEWRKESVIRDRISYFKQNGIDLGDSYEEYLNNEEAKSITPSKEEADKLVESRNRLLNEYKNMFYLNTDFHKKVRGEITQLNLLDKEDGFNAAIYDSVGKTFVCPNVRKNDNGYELYSLMVISCNDMDGVVDHNIYHELNHIFEATLIKADDKSYEEVSGWDWSDNIIDENYDGMVDLNEKRMKRPYELLSEIINEKIAQEIHMINIEKGIHVFDTSETAQVKNVTSYECTSFLVDEFFQEFKEDIIKSRRNNNIEIIWDKVGKENFDELNSLFHIFNENLAGFRYFAAVKDIKNNVESEKSLLLVDLNKKKDQILENMRNYALNHSTENEGKSL